MFWIESHDASVTTKVTTLSDKNLSLTVPDWLINVNFHRSDQVDLDDNFENACRLLYQPAWRLH